MNRIDHTSHQHPATPAGRKACRKATRAQAVQDSKLGKAPQDWSDEAKAATEWVDAAVIPFVSRAIKIDFKLKDGKRCSVVFDRYGMNAELFRTAAANGWDSTRTINQACSEAISAVGQQHGFNNIDTYDVRSVD